MTRANVRTPCSPGRTLSPVEAAQLVRPGMWLDYGVTLSQPDVFNRALPERSAYEKRLIPRGFTFGASLGTRR